MPATQLTDGVLSWAGDLDEGTVQQARNTAQVPVVTGHVALMPDAHLGYGATVGSVIPTEGAIIPSAVGVDIGCGMVAVETDLDASDLPDDLRPLLSRVGEAIPAGVGQGHDHARVGAAWLDEQPDTPELVQTSDRERRRAAEQFGTLGSGNHFVEVCLDERDTVWAVLHSGSRGVGNTLAQRHIDRAKGLLKQRHESLADPDLAYVVEGTAEFREYVNDLEWAQRYAYANRERMVDLVLHELFDEVGKGREVDRVNCHHNYAAREHHDGRELWITRKGAIRAREGDRGVIPGSMGASSYIVRGLGNPLAYESAAHGAGRKMSRRQAKKRFATTDLAEAMGDRTWLSDHAGKLLDEIPAAYKDIDEVMERQRDLVQVERRLRQVLNYKGT
ncbi:MAG: RtcB family protein [Actinobacteria bacterium]|nr:RtcB family protein [Actinomycetota bacterium]